MAQEPTPGALARALCAARLELKGVVYKGGFNQHNRYHYVGHEDVLTSGAREALSKHDLAIVQVGVEYLGEVPGGKAQVLLWRGRYKLLHASGESLDIDVVGTTQANDKSAYQANTMLDRTIYLRLLALAGSSEEETEDDRAHDKLRREAAAQKQGGAQPQTSSQSAQQGASAPQQRPDYMLAIDALAARVARIEHEPELVKWAKELRVARCNDKREKAAAWEAFQKRAGEIKLDPHAVLKQADDALMRDNAEARANAGRAA